MIPNLNKEELNNMLTKTKGSNRISGLIGESIAYEVLVRGLHFDIYRSPSLIGSFPQYSDILTEKQRKRINYEKDFWGDKYDVIKNWDKPYFADLVIKKDNKICFVEVKSGTGELALHQKECLEELKRLGFRVGILKVKFKIEYYGIEWHEF
jgi:hypothetical protein